MEHNMGAYHVENPQRIEAIYRMLEKEISFPYTEIEPRPADVKEIQMVHSSSYIESIKETSGKERIQLDPDTATSARSYEVALLAAGGLLTAIDLVMEGKIHNGFALVRPPGHHAEASRAMGFCLFNNVAVGAEYLVKKFRIKRILILDWDLHHGNGTQHSFYSRKDILYFPRISSLIILELDTGKKQGRTRGRDLLSMSRSLEEKQTKIISLYSKKSSPL